MNDSTTPPSPQSILFARGVISRLETWETLRIAIQQNWGGPGSTEKRTWLASIILDAFLEGEEAQTPDEIYIEEMLLQVMLDEYETVVGDESAQVVARDIVRMWEEIKLGRQDEVLRFEGMAERLKGKKAALREVLMDEGEDEEDDDESGDESEGGVDEVNQQPRSHEPEVDEDGFTLVKAKRKGRQ